MQRALFFGSEPLDRIRFKLLWDGFVSGSQVERVKLQREQKQQSREDRKAELRIKRAFLAISEPVEDDSVPAPKDDDVYDRRTRKLTTGGEMVLDQSDFSRLVRYVDQVPWIMDVIDHVSELEDWLDAADRMDGTQRVKSETKADVI